MHSTDPAPADQAAERPESVAATGERLRGVLRQMASPVVVVTCVGARGPRGATIGSFASASLAPPLVTFNVTHGTRFHEAMATAPSFAVHLLASDQAPLANRFAADLDDQLEDMPHLKTPFGLPLLDDTLGILLCRPHALVPVADHTLVVAEVKELIAGREAGPLLYFQQSYRGIGRAV